MTFSAVQTGAKAGVGERYLPKRVELAAKIETPNEVSPRLIQDAPQGQRELPQPRRTPKYSACSRKVILHLL